MGDCDRLGCMSHGQPIADSPPGLTVRFHVAGAMLVRPSGSISRSMLEVWLCYRRTHLPAVNRADEMEMEVRSGDDSPSIFSGGFAGGREPSKTVPVMKL